MQKAYEHKLYESDIYKRWEESGAFNPSEAKETFSIIMPPPNSNGELHLGHASFVAISDVLIRYHRMKGEAALWLPGVDHAGILTQVTFEKKLKKEENKARHDLGREEFVRRCYEFCMNNKHIMESQIKALGASCDWSREKFTLDPEVSKLVYQTFLRMHKEGLVYRGFRIVNWCPRCRSTLADAELEWKEQEDKMYYIKYKIVNGGDVTIATARPETIWIDTHAAVNPTDKKRMDLIGKKLINPLSEEEMIVIGDESVDPEFGTGVLKLTPAHDLNDYDVAVRHSLPMKNGIDFDGKLMPEAGEWAGLKTLEAREKIATFLNDKGLLVKAEPYKHEVATCERCGTVIEPLLSRQWFVKIKPLAQRAIESVESGKVKIVPSKYEAMYFNWMRQIRDWPISRQIWWGHQLPVWYRREDQKTEEQLKEFELLKAGDTRARTDVLESPTVAIEKPEGKDVLQDPDTFDTWFSSGQWPVNTLKSGGSDFERFYPTSVMNTAYEILFLWVARMIMFGLYLTDEVPFKTALINGVIRDEKGDKMSKSKGNGVNVTEMVDKYGADAVRLGLVIGRDSGNDVLMSKQKMEEKIRGMRNFANKIWNAARFVTLLEKNDESGSYDIEAKQVAATVTAEMANLLDEMRIGQAAELVYEKFWHWYCDEIIERGKKGEVSKRVLRELLEGFLKQLHPFMPFVTEAVWQEIGAEGQLISAKWPTTS